MNHSSINILHTCPRIANKLFTKIGYGPGAEHAAKTKNEKKKAKLGYLHSVDTTIYDLFFIR